MLEVYNERIRDLFVPFSRLAEKKGGGLRLRDSPALGVVRRTKSQTPRSRTMLRVAELGPPDPSIISPLNTIHKEL